MTDSSNDKLLSLLSDLTNYVKANLVLNNNNIDSFSKLVIFRLDRIEETINKQNDIISGLQVTSIQFKLLLGLSTGGGLLAFIALIRSFSL